MELDTILIYVTSACVGGFIFLLGWVMKLNAGLEKRATYSWCEEQLVKKDVVNIRLKNIEDHISDIKDSLKTIAKNGNAGRNMG